jgi:hypothetical protein
MNKAEYANNVYILNELLRAAKKHGLAAVQLDVSKSLDTTPHEDIMDGRNGISELVVQFILDSYCLQSY